MFEPWKMKIKNSAFYKCWSFFNWRGQHAVWWLKKDFEWLRKMVIQMLIALFKVITQEENLMNLDSVALPGVSFLSYYR